MYRFLDPGVRSDYRGKYAPHKPFVGSGATLENWRLHSAKICGHWFCFEFGVLKGNAQGDGAKNWDLEGQRAR